MRRAAGPRLEHCTLSGGLDADEVRIDHDLSLDRSTVIGAVRLSGARIGGQLRCAGTRIEVPKESALIAVAADIIGGVFLQPWVPDDGREPTPCQIIGQVDLERARIGGPLNCEGAILCNPGGRAINAHQAQITAGVFLRALPMANLRLPCEVTGEVRLIVARITGPVGFDGATLTNGGGSALNAERAEITGGLYLSGDGVNRAASLSRTGTFRLNTEEWRYQSSQQPKRVK